MQGRTPQEVAELAAGLYQQNLELQAHGAHGAPAPISTHAAQSTPMHGAPQGNGSPPNPDLMYSDPAEYQRQYDAYVEARFNAQLTQLAAPVLQQNADTARELSKMGAYADVWRRWEPEIEQQLAGIPTHQRTKQLYDQAALLVRGLHAEELANERAQQMLASRDTGTESTHGAGGAPPASPGDALDEAWDSGHPFFEKAKSYGMSKERIREHCARSGISVADYVKNATLGTVVQSPSGIQRAGGA